MQDWQVAALNSENLRIDQDQSTGYRLVIRKTDVKNRMSIPEIVATIRHTNRKPVIMCPDDPFRGMFADRREVLDILLHKAVIILSRCIIKVANRSRMLERHYLLRP